MPGKRSGSTAPFTRLPLGLILPIALTACADMTLGPDPAVVASPGQPAGQTYQAFTCRTSRLVEGGPAKYRYGRVELLIPEHVVERAERVHTVTYQRVREEDGVITRFARCEIPDDPAAMGVLMMRFSIHASRTDEADQ